MKWIVFIWAIWITGIVTYQFLAAKQEVVVQSAAHSGLPEINTNSVNDKIKWSQDELDWLTTHGLLEHALTLDYENGLLLREMIFLSLDDEYFERAILDSISKYYPEISAEKLLTLPNRNLIPQATNKP